MENLKNVKNPSIRKLKKNHNWKLFFPTLVFIFSRQNLVAPFEVFKPAICSMAGWNLRGIKLVWYYITFVHAHFCICALFPYNLRSNMYKIALVHTKIQEGQAKPGTGHVFVICFVTVLKITNFSCLKLPTITSNSRGEIGWPDFEIIFKITIES